MRCRDTAHSRWCAAVILLTAANALPWYCAHNRWCASAILLTAADALKWYSLVKTSNNRWKFQQTLLRFLMSDCYWYLYGKFFGGHYICKILTLNEMIFEEEQSLNHKIALQHLFLQILLLNLYIFRTYSFLPKPWSRRVVRKFQCLMRYAYDVNAFLIDVETLMVAIK